MPLERERLRSTTVNAFDVINLMTNLTIEIVSAISHDRTERDRRLDHISNQLEGFAKQVPDQKAQFLISQLAAELIATEESGLG